MRMKCKWVSVLAAMNHPNIAHLFGLETAERILRESPAPSREVAESGEAEGAASRPQDLETSGPQGATPSSPVTFLVMELASSNISGPLFSVAPDGLSILAGVSASGEQSPYLDLVVGWVENLGER